MTFAGQDLYVWIADETTQGTPTNTGTASPIVDVVSVSGRGVTKEYANVRRFGDRERVGNNPLRIDEDNLSIDLTICDSNYTLLFESFDENDTVASDSKTIIIANATDPSSATVVEVYKGCVQVGAEVSISNDGVMTGSVEFSRLSSTYDINEANAGVDSYNYTAHSTITSVYVPYSDVTLTKTSGFDTAASITSIVHEFNVSATSDIVKKFRLNGSEYPTGSVLGEYSVSGSFIIDYDNISDFEEIIANDQDTAAVLTLTHTHGDIVINGCTFESVASDANANELITVEISFSGNTVDFT